MIVTHVLGRHRRWRRRSRQAHGCGVDDSGKASNARIAGVSLLVCEKLLHVLIAPSCCDLIEIYVRQQTSAICYRN